MLKISESIESTEKAKLGLVVMAVLMVVMIMVMMMNTYLKAQNKHINRLIN